jgi:hypothetical protein
MAEINKEDLFSDEALNAPKELAKNLGAVAASIDAITSASAKSDKQLKEATGASKITKQTEQLTLQEKELLKVQNQISVALAKNNDEYIEHKRGLDAINKAVKDKIMAGREDQTLTGKLTKGMADLKKELKEAKNAMIIASEAGGTMSKEYQDAAKSAGEIADKIGDAKDEAKVFANDTAFGALGTRIGLLKDKVMSLDFKGVGEQLKGLGKIIMANPLMLLAAVVIGIGAALYAMRDSIKPVSDVLAFMGKQIDFVIQKLKDFSDWLGISTFAAQDKAKAIIEGAEAEVKAVAKAADQQIAIAAALGQDTVEMEKQKWIDIKAEADKGMKAAFDPTKPLKDQSEQYKGFIELAADASTQLQVITNKGIKAEADAKAKAAAEDKKIAEETAKFIAKIQEQSFSHKWELYKQDQKLKEEFLAKFKALGVEEVKVSGDIDKAILAAKVSIQARIEAGARDSQQKQKDDLANSLKETQDIYNSFSSAIGNLLDSITASQLQDLELQKKANKEKLDRDLEAAGNNEAAKTELKKKAAKDDALIQQEQLKLRRRMAIYDKATALIAAGINTAVGITNAASKVATIPLIPFIAALGALQIAAIAAKPIPKFAGGTKSSPAGMALVGELGSELLFGPDGSVGITPDKPTLMNLAKGTQVIPNDETMRMLAMAGVQGQNTVARDYSMVSELRSLKEAISNGDEMIVNAIKSSAGVYEQQGSLLYKHSKTHEGNVIKVRKKILG